MGFRTFKDRQGGGWQVRTESKRLWWLEPLPGNEATRRSTTAPTYTDDPFELSELELRKLLDTARPAPRMADKPPLFKDPD